jgi:DNA-binding NarL/FixJ family response regulator
MRSTAVTCTAVVYGLEALLAEPLTAALVRLGATVYHLSDDSAPEQCANLAERVAADVIFCGDGSPGYRSVLEAVASGGRPPAVVVVGRLGDTERWLDALEAGAFDYCAPPLEADQVLWMLESVRLRGVGRPNLAPRVA